MASDPDLDRLLIDLVEADRQVPREQRQHFYVARTSGPPGVQLIHPGWKPLNRRVPEVDLEHLASEGLLRCSYSSSGDTLYSVSSAGFDYYKNLMTEAGEPAERVQSKVKDYLDSSAFRERYPSAYRKWADAEALLWGDDSLRNLTSIGHLCREALQEFTTSLLIHTKTTNAEADPAKTVSRLRTALNSKRAAQSANISKFLDALLAYWGTVSDLVQRQEHGGQKEGLPLTFADGLRIVRQSMIVMYEIDTTISR